MARRPGRWPGRISGSGRGDGEITLGGYNNTIPNLPPSVGSRVLGIRYNQYLFVVDTVC